MLSITRPALDDEPPKPHPPPRFVDRRVRSSRTGAPEGRKTSCPKASRPLWSRHASGGPPARSSRRCREPGPSLDGTVVCCPERDADRSDGLSCPPEIESSCL